MDIQKINESIHRLVIPYKDIFTTVYTVSYDGGCILFDAASYDSDIDNYVVPMLSELGITKEKLKYVFISHHHTDHSGGLGRLLEYYPEVCVLSRSAALVEKFGGNRVNFFEDRESILDVFRTVAIPGHTQDSAGLFDKRTKTLITGDSLQLYGIFGSDLWGSNVGLPAEHLEAISGLRKLDIENIYTAHDFHPYGYAYIGREAVENALDAATRPLLTIKKMIENHPDLTDAEIQKKYNSSAKIPPVREGIFRAVREASKNNRM